MSFLADYLGPFLLVAGGFFCLTGAIGVLRFPDFFSRIHAASVTDTLGAALMLGGLMCMSTGMQELVKLILILLFLMITGPTAVHAMAYAAHTAGATDKTKLEELEIRVNPEGGGPSSNTS